MIAARVWSRDNEDQREKYRRAQTSLSKSLLECTESRFRPGRRSPEATFSRRYLPGILLSVLAAGAIMLGSLPASAQDLPPLRDDRQNLEDMLKALSTQLVPPSKPTLGTDPFGAIAPDIAGLERLAQFGLVKVPEDASALLSFLHLVLVTRLQELGVEDEVQVQPLAPTARFTSCDVLGLAVLFDARKTVHDGHAVVAVVVNIDLWQLIPESEHGTPSSTCAADKGALSDAGLADVFLVEPDERDKTLALAKEALLSIVDRFILYRLVLTNSTARERVRSWARK